MVKEVVHRIRMNYKVGVKGKTKIYHANLLKRNFKRDEDIAIVAAQIDLGHALELVASIGCSKGCRSVWTYSLRDQ